MNILSVIALVTAISFFVLNAITAPVIVDGSSMNPTLNNYDYGQMNITKTKRNHLKRFDIIVFDANLSSSEEKTTLIKRIIGLPNETISINEVTGELTVDGQVVPQKFIGDEYVRLTCHSSKGLACGQELTIPENSYYVLGDNRNHSTDSEHGLGLVKHDDVIGVLWFVYAQCESIDVKYDKNNNSSYVCVGKKSTRIRFF